MYFQSFNKIKNKIPDGDDGIKITCGKWVAYKAHLTSTHPLNVS